MGIQINGQTDTITAIDGALTVSGADLPTVTNLNATGIVTATSFSGPLTGNATGLSGNPNISVSTIGVNGASPQTPIDAISNSSGNGITVRGRSADGLGNIRFTSNNYATLYGGFKHDASTLTIFNELSGSLKLGTNGIDRATIDGSGRLTLPYQPSFYTVGTNYSQSAAAYSIIIPNVVSYNQGSHYNGSTGRFTAPIAGRYIFGFWGLSYPHNTEVNTIRGFVNGSGAGQEVQFNGTSSQHEECSGTLLLNLNANDVFDWRYYQASGSAKAYGSQWNMWGYLIG
jgi:hypothetical protein